MTYKTIHLHPHKMQFLVDELWNIVLMITMVFLAGYEYLPIPELIPFLFLASLLLGIYLIYRYFYMTRIVYVITGEQLQCECGIFSIQKNFIELYRIIDYQEEQSFLQLIFGIKTITIYSGDRSNPKIKLIGIKSQYELIDFLRERVEYNKIRRHIYEFTNN